MRTRFSCADASSKLDFDDRSRRGCVQTVCRWHDSCPFSSIRPGEGLLDRYVRVGPDDRSVTEQVTSSIPVAGAARPRLRGRPTNARVSVNELHHRTSVTRRVTRVAAGYGGAESSRSIRRPGGVTAARRFSTRRAWASFMRLPKNRSFHQLLRVGSPSVQRRDRRSGLTFQ